MNEYRFKFPSSQEPVTFDFIFIERIYKTFLTNGKNERVTIENQNSFHPLTVHTLFTFEIESKKLNLFIIIFVFI